MAEVDDLLTAADFVALKGGNPDVADSLRRIASRFEEQAHDFKQTTLAHDEEEARAEQAEARAEALTRALERIANGTVPGWSWNKDKVRAFARAALAETSPPQARAEAAIPCAACGYIETRVAINPPEKE